MEKSSQEIQLRLISIGRDFQGFTEVKHTEAMLNGTQANANCFALPELSCVVVNSLSAQDGQSRLKLIFFDGQNNSVVAQETEIEVGNRVCYFGYNDELVIVDSGKNLAERYKISSHSPPRKMAPSENGIDQNWV